MEHLDSAPSVQRGRHMPMADEENDAQDDVFVSDDFDMDDDPELKEAIRVSLEADRERAAVVARLTRPIVTAPVLATRATNADSRPVHAQTIAIPNAHVRPAPTASSYAPVRPFPTVAAAHVATPAPRQPAAVVPAANNHLSAISNIPAKRSLPVHVEEVTFECPICNAMFTNQVELENHVTDICAVAFD